jgi:FKBP-type peptidyl-prolyl cis-trans isomerase
LKHKPSLRYANELHPKPSGLVGAEPKPIMPTDPPPGFLAQAQFIEGIGNVASRGDRLTVQYVGYDYSGKKFGSSWEEGHPFAFTLGKGEAIKGWEEALEAAEPGDRTELVVPPHLAQGPFPRNLPKDSTLVFVLELLRVESPGEVQAASPARPSA